MKYSLHGAARFLGVSETAMSGLVKRGTVLATLEVENGRQRYQVEEAELQRYAAVRAERIAKRAAKKAA